jgi:spoIIIJ-associated protein
MPMTDKVAAANQINDFLKTILANSGLKLKYRISVNPPLPEDAPPDASRAEIAVDLAGPDSTLLLERGNALLNALESLSAKMLRLESFEHDKLSFDSRNSKVARKSELKLAAEVAAERVRKSGQPHLFAPMNSRERRLVHLYLSQESDLRTESSGEGPRRAVVLYPKDFKGTVSAPAPSFGGGRGGRGGGGAMRGGRGRR